jgi:anti-sigma factor RsiW
MMGLDKRDTIPAHRNSSEDSDYPGSIGAMPPMPPSDYDGGMGDHNPRYEACDLIMVNLSAYLDGELDQDTFDLVNSHIDRCSRCTAIFASMQQLDGDIEREWRDGTPLPSFIEMQDAVDAIMNSLPPAPEDTPEYAPRRVHAKVRWMRFATGLFSAIGLLTLLWSSYRLGYAQGRQTRQINGPAAPLVTWQQIKGIGPF